MGGATAERGGRSKRFYQVTHAGKALLRDLKSMRDELWALSRISLAK
jgi:DNA-binding PadR family transcriptional regulator